MNSNQLSLLDLTKEEDFLKTVPNNLFTTIYQTEITGQGVLHTGHLAGEYKEHSFQQHSIVVHLKSEQNSLRRLGNLLGLEKIGIGDMAIVPAKVTHWQRIETEVTEKVIIAIEPEVMAHTTREVINPNDIELLPTFAQSDPLIQHIALNLKTNLDSDNYDRLYAESLFNLLLMHLLRHYTTKKFLPENKNYGDGLPNYKLKLAKKYIQDHLDNPIKLSDIASLLDISQFYFCHLFKKSTGIAPYKYVIQQRVEKAKELIEQNKMSLSEIAYECGFSSQSQMTQHFRKYVGVTPKVYSLAND